MQLDQKDQMMNDALANPQRATWAARHEMRHVRDIMRHLYAEDSEIVRKAELAFELACWLDDEMERS